MRLRFVRCFSHHGKSISPNMASLLMVTWQFSCWQQDYYSDMLFRLFYRNNQIYFKHKTFSSTGFENKKYFSGTKIGAFQKTKILAIFINSKQLYCVTSGPYVTQTFIKISAVSCGKKIIITQISYFPYLSEIIIRLFKI